MRVCVILRVRVCACVRACVCVCACAVVLSPEALRTSSMGKTCVCMCLGLDFISILISGMVPRHQKNGFIEENNEHACTHMCVYVSL